MAVRAAVGSHHQTPRRAFYRFNHFHRARLSTGNIEYGQMEIGVAADNIVFSLGELTGNLRTLTK